MQRFLAAVLAILASTATLYAQSPGQLTQGPGNTAGLLYAANFGQWKIRGNSSFSWSGATGCAATAAGMTMNPVFKVGTPVQIVDANPALNEVVTPTAVNFSESGCSISVTPVHQHYSFYITSATAGLQESINWAAGLPYSIIVTPDWSRIGGVTSTITSAKGNTNAWILDERYSCIISYGWNGSAYSQQGDLCSSATNSCVITGIGDTDVLSVHPSGSCYGSVDFTWDDGSSKQNLIVGNGTTSLTSGTQTYAIGASNQIYPPQGSSSISQIGILGNNNTAQTNRETYLFGEFNSATSTAASGNNQYDIYLFGYNNQASGSTINNLMFLGSSNVATQTTNGMNTIYALGVSNTFEDTLATTDEVEVVGEANDVNGAQSTATVLGYWNTLDNVTSSGIGDGNTVVVGSQNTNKNTGTATRTAYTTTVGQLNYLHDCSDCTAIGTGVEESTNDHMSIGMSRTPELQITSGNVQRTPEAMASGGLATAIINSTLKVGGAGGTCLVSFTGGTGSGGTATAYVNNNGYVTAGSQLPISANGSYTVAPTGGTLSNGTNTNCAGKTINVVARIALLATCSASVEGSFAQITDSTTNALGATITGGGTDHVWGVCGTADGTTYNWAVAAAPGSGGGSSGVSSFTGDGTLISNSSSTGAVTATLANTGVGYGVWGNTGSASGAPGYHAMSSYPAAAFPTLNQNTTGSAGSVVNSLTFNVSGGAAPGGSYNGASALAVDYHTVGAAKALASCSDESSTFTPADGNCYFVTASVSVATPSAGSFVVFSATTSSAGQLALTGTTIADGGNCASYISGTTLTLPASQSVSVRSDGTTIRASCTAAGATGTVTTSGTPAQYQLATFSGTTAITGVSVGTAGRMLLDQGAAAYPAFEAMSGDCTLTSTGAVTCTKTNGAAFAASATTDTTNASNISSGTLGAARLPAGILSCTEVWSGSGTSSALQAGDDAISNNTCYNDSGATRTITAVKCRSDNASNTTTVNPTFGSAGTGTTILSGALTCGSSYAYSSSGTISNASWTTGAGIDPGMGGTLTGTSIAVIVEYHY